MAYTDSPARGRDWCPCGGAARRRSDFEAHEPEANDNHGDSGCHGLRNVGDCPCSRPGSAHCRHRAIDGRHARLLRGPTRGSGSPARRLDDCDRRDPHERAPPTRRRHGRPLPGRPARARRERSEALLAANLPELLRLHAAADRAQRRPSPTRGPTANDLRRPRTDRRSLALFRGRAEPRDDPFGLSPCWEDELLPRIRAGAAGRVSAAAPAHRAFSTGRPHCRSGDRVRSRSG